MNNTGVFNASGSLIFLFLLLLPTAFHILKAMMSLSDNNQQPMATFEPEEYAPTVNIGKIVYNKNKVSTGEKKNKNKQKSNLGLEKRKKTQSTPKNISDDAINALVSLGFNKGKAKAMISKMCINSSYKDPSKLIKDCFSENNS
tara:strand:+ start:236 stop:667 length:432 start_codon:yes stop_codon:yes gene_type:complete